MLCRFWQSGTCRYGEECRFSHGTPGKGPPVSQTVSVCPYFLSGSCRFGDSCRNSHAWDEPSFKEKGKWKGWKGWKGEGKWKGKGKGEREDSAEKQLTGPHLGKGSELLKVWSMPDDLGHDDGIETAILLHDRLCTGGSDQKLKLWRGEVVDGVVTLMEDNNVELVAAVTALCFHAESSWLFCGLADGQIKAYRQEPSAECTLTAHAGAITSLLVHASILLSGSRDATVRAWRHDGTCFACLATLPSSMGQVLALCVQGGLWLGAEQGVVLVTLETFQPATTIQLSAPVVDLICFENYIIVALADGVVKVFDSCGKEMCSHGPLGEHTTNTAVTLVRHPAGKMTLLCGQAFGYVTAYDMPDFSPRGTFCTGYGMDVTSIVDMGANSLFITCGLGGDVIVWRWRDRSLN